jgi:hypothetical protein
MNHSAGAVVHDGVVLVFAGMRVAVVARAVFIISVEKA